MSTSDSCVFCDIVDGKGEASMIHRDDEITSFMDISPLVEGHALVIPNYHTPDLEGLRDDIGARMFAFARRLATAMPGSEIRCEGVNFFLANGAVAGQTVFHVHLHVIPRYAGDGFGIQTEALKRARPGRLALDRHADALRRAAATGV